MLGAMPVPVSAQNFLIYGCSTTPTLVLIDRSGIVRLYHPGAMTYEELAAMLGCTVTEARERVQLECLDRKISRDGEKRAKLSVAMTGIFIEGIKAGTLALDQAVDDLKTVHGLMKQECNGPSRALRALTARR